jgi:hypothetical protein
VSSVFVETKTLLEPVTRLFEVELMARMLGFVLALVMNIMAQSASFLSFDSLRLNKDGAPYPSQYTGEGRGPYSIDSGDAIAGNSLRMQIDTGILLAQFNAHNANGTRGFAHEYAEGLWQFDTYNRMEFWIKAPRNASPITPGQHVYEVGTYIKTFDPPDPYTDESGNNHWYHKIAVSPNGHWTKVILNHHPHHLRGQSGSTDWGVRTYPTGEVGRNYFDALTRWYIHEVTASSIYPKVFHLDQALFWRDGDSAAQLADSLLYSLTASYGDGRLTFTASALKSAVPLWHDVRWARFDIRKGGGWEAASVAPAGRIRPRDRGYNGMVYQTDSLLFSVGDTIWLAVKPENSALYAQMSLPILDSLGRGATQVPVPPPEDTIPTPPPSCLPDTVVLVDTLTVRDTVLQRDTLFLVPKSLRFMLEP